MNTFSVIMNEVNELFLRRFFAFAQNDGAVNQDYAEHMRAMLLVVT